MNHDELDNIEGPVVPRGESPLHDAPIAPLGVGDFEGEAAHDSFAGDGGGRRIDTGLLLLVLIVVVAGGGLFSMRTLSRVSASPGITSEVESTIERFLKVFAGAGDGGGTGDGAFVLNAEQNVLDVLTEVYSERTVPWDNVQRNPFILFEAKEPTEPDPAVDTNDDQRRWEKARADRLSLFNRASERFHLKSVLMGREPLANLNDKIVRAGETMVIEPEGVEFRVVEIGTDVVILVAEDEEFDVSLEVEVEVVRER